MRILKRENIAPIVCDGGDVHVEHGYRGEPDFRELATFSGVHGTFDQVLFVEYSEAELERLGLEDAFGVILGKRSEDGT